MKQQIKGDSYLWADWRSHQEYRRARKAQVRLAHRRLRYAYKRDLRRGLEQPNPIISITL